MLPLVQFEPAEGIAHEEAMNLIQSMPIPEVDNAQVEGADILRINHDIDYTDPFMDKVEEVGIVLPSIVNRLRDTKEGVVCVFVSMFLCRNQTS